MNEEEFEKHFVKMMFKKFYDTLNEILTERIKEILDYVENDCVCANYKQKHRSELLKKLTGENKNFIYKGS